MLSYSKARISGLTATEHAPKSNFTRSHTLTVGDLGTRLWYTNMVDPYMALYIDVEHFNEHLKFGINAQN